LPAFIPVVVANCTGKDEIAERIGQEQLDDIASRLGLTLPPINLTKCKNRCGCRYCSSHCRDSAWPAHSRSPLCAPSQTQSEALTAFEDRLESAGVATQSQRDLIYFMVNILSKIAVAKDEGRWDANMPLGDYLERLSHMAYVSEMPFVIPEMEKDDFELVRALFPTLHDGESEIRYP
jgi:hypothetical protein